MSTYQSRVIKERDDLRRKAESLSSFLTTEKYKELSVIGQRLLVDQLDAMNTYWSILDQRIDRFQIEDKRRNKEHEPKPVIRKGEVYAYLYPEDCLEYVSATCGREINKNRRQLTLEEMPAWVSVLVEKHGMPVKARTKHKILSFETGLEHGL